MDDIQHIFFDLDHTLWDFEKNSSEVLREIFVEMQLHDFIDNVDSFINTYQRINAKYWDLYNHGKVTKEKLRYIRFQDTLSEFKVIGAEKKAVLLGQNYIKRSPHKTNLFPDAHDTLQYLNEKYQLHIITNGFTEIQYIKLDNCGLTNYFDLILCTEEVGVNKPNPLVFNTALSRANANASQSLMIGDNPETDIRGAQNCAMHTVLFNPHQHLHDVNSIEIQGLKELRDLL
ncbi:MAG: YjjG family noncanonical pyrimidine nucleotidase [Crocinitomix sp.]|nr:YjjG family noncanonical pyrimidine nucleotidase [Crocinitomix sp.]